ncbi:hypothetical protein EG68_02018 [Paragonimus skrjabini miyazakii]|uniref:PDZ domain-containing protein n=1 Tax=Paragonimus skrjabini miyazakii TaxID=59628 RepID=A0A8S9Z0Y3_9TREM|nr:hypothetical protein EG68_02018 [Paragonimus skrjabini miyazakii]
MKPSTSEYVCDASETPNILSIERKETRSACCRDNAPSSSKLDGRLPDIDYTKMTMKNLDELNDRILMEFEHVFIRLKPGADILLSRTTRNLEDNPTEEVFIDGNFKDELVSQTGGRVQPGDQLLQVNDRAVSSLNQAQQLIKQSGNQFSLLVVRPNRQITELCAQCPIMKEQSKRILYENMVSERSSIPDGRLRFNGNENFPHVVYTTADRLARTISLQQRLLQCKLRRTLPRSTVSIPSSVVHPMSEIGYHSNWTLGERRTSQSENEHCSNVKSQSSENIYKPFELGTESVVHPKTDWVIKRRANGTRYITRRHSRMDDSSSSVSPALSSFSPNYVERTLVRYANISTTNTALTNERVSLQNYRNHGKYSQQTKQCTTGSKRTSFKLETTSVSLPKYEDADIVCELERLRFPSLLFKRSQSKCSNVTKTVTQDDSAEQSSNTTGSDMEPLISVLTM